MSFTSGIGFGRAGFSQSQLSVASAFSTPGGLAIAPSGSASRARITGEGFVCRFSPIAGVTPKSALAAPLWLPALLDPFAVDETALHNQYDTLSAGEFSQPAQGPPTARKLRTMNVTAITLAWDAPWLVATGQHSFDVRSRLFDVLRARKAVHMLVTYNPNPGLPSEFDGFVTFRDISKEIRNGELDTHYLTLAITEWRDPSGKRRSSSPTGTSRKQGVQLPATHVLKATDTLASLSFEYYGRYDRWRFIRDANAIGAKFGQKTPLVQLPGPWKVGYKVKIPVVPTGGVAP